MVNLDKKQLIKELGSVLSDRLADNFKDIVLFGSQVTGKAHPYSDYDVLIVLKKKLPGK